MPLFRDGGDLVEATTNTLNEGFVIVLDEQLIGAEGFCFADIQRLKSITCLTLIV